MKAILLDEWNGSFYDNPQYMPKVVLVVNDDFDFDAELEKWKETVYKEGYYPPQFVRYLLEERLAQSLPFEEYLSYYLEGCVGYI